MDKQEFEFIVNKIQGKVIAVVYIFENEDSQGYEHYDIWKGDVISGWLNAIQVNNCIPYIIDLRTFIFKAINRTLPKIDYVLNLNNGNTNLSVLAIVPSICSFLNIPCIPCNAVSIISGEHKVIANNMAKSVGLQLPLEMSNKSENIFRPLCYGSSRGTKKVGYNTIKYKNGFYQQFVKGYDITTPLLYNPLTQSLEALPSIMYYSENKDVKWFFNEQVKEKRTGYMKKTILIEEEISKKYKELAQRLDINCYCRIDARIKCDTQQEWNDLFTKPVIEEKIYFIEINPMPTLKTNINFLNSLDTIDNNSPFYEIYEIYRKLRGDTPMGFILICSMLSKAMH